MSGGPTWTRRTSRSSGSTQTCRRRLPGCPSCDAAFRSSSSLDRPDVEVQLDDGTWAPGEARMRWQDDAETWWFNVQWRPPGENTRKLDNFPAERVRPT